MTTVDDINRELVKLWWDWPKDIPRPYGPVLRTEVEPEGILFVGLNPSASESGWARVMKRAGRTQPENVLGFFAWPPPPEFEEHVAHELEELARRHYEYFQVHREVGELTGVRCSHLDLFAYRETKSADLLPRVLSDLGSNELSPFGEAQFVLFERLMDLARPRAVVVISARASRIYLRRRRPAEDPHLGCYLDAIGGRRDVPVLFSETLSARGMLGSFARQRLLWHIAHVLRIDLDHLSPLRPQSLRWPQRLR